MLEVEHLKKRYGDLQAVHDVSFRVETGESVGLLGPNGAGKTTTISMITGLIAPDSGKVLIKGNALKSDIDPIKRKLGIVPQDLALYEELSAEENLQLFGSLYGIKGKELSSAIELSLKLVDLIERRRDLIQNFSGGMKRRINLAAALLHQPDFILLDEPTVGVDPQSRNAIFENIETLKQLGKSILYTTHYMEEAERLCDRIIIMDQGKVIANNTLRGLSALLPATNLLCIDIKEKIANEDQLKGIEIISGVSVVSFYEGTLELSLKTLDMAPLALTWLLENDLHYEHFSTKRANLENVFLTLTGRSLRDS